MRYRTGMILCAVGLAVCLAGGCGSAGAASNSSGLAAFQSGNYEKAIGLFNQAITQDSQKASYYINRGMAQCNAARYEEALESFEQAAEKNPSSVNAYRGIGIVCMKQGRYEDAVEAFDKALEHLRREKGEQGCDILAYRAEAKEKSSDYAGAAEDYEKLISYNYEKEQMYLYLGYVYLAQGDCAAALTCFQQSINIDHRDFEKYLEMIEKLKQYGFTDSAAVVADAALSVPARSAQDRFYHGLLYLEKGQEKEAFSEFEQSYNAGFDAAGYYLGYCYEQREQYSEAELIYQKQLALSPEDARLYNQLAVCRIKQEKYEDALVFIRQGLALEDDEVTDDLLWNQIICYERKKDFDTAAELLIQYLSLYPEDQEAALELSYIVSR